MSNGSTSNSFVLDTNVVLDMISIHDLAREAEQGLQGIEYRRQRARSAVLLGAYFHESRAQSLSLHEAFRILTYRVPRDDQTLERGFLQIFLYFVKDFVLPNWRFDRLNDTESFSGTAADDELLRIAREQGLALLTNEGLTPSGVRPFPGATSLRAKAQVAKVPVFTAAELLEDRAADTMMLARGFFDRWDTSARSYIEEHRRTIGDDHIDAWVTTARDVYEWILAPD